MAASSLTLQATGQLQNAAAYQKLIVAWRNGSPVRLATWATSSTAFRVSTPQLVHGPALHFTSGAEAAGNQYIEVVDGVKALLQGLKQQLPPSINLDIIQDRRRPSATPSPMSNSHSCWRSRWCPRDLPFPAHLHRDRDPRIAMPIG